MQAALHIIYLLFIAFQAILAVYLLTPFLLLLLYSLVRLFHIPTPFERRPVLTDKEFEFGLIITAHQEIQFVPPLVDSILRQTYGKLHVYIVADDCDTSALSFTDPRISLLEPQPALHAKVRSIHYALEHFVRQHDAIIILDVDNLLHPDFLDIMNRHFQKGFRAVQANFKPKNTDTDYARMDAIGDMFNFFIEREARMHLGLSSAIWGAGLAVDLDIYRNVSYSDFLGGFDKRLQAYLVQQVDLIAFAPNAILFDEKITTGQSLENQRTRWISSYFKYFRDTLAIFGTGLRRGSFNLLYFGFNTLRPPLFMVLAASLLFAIADFFLLQPLGFAWLAVWASFLLSFVLIVTIKGRDIRYIKTLARIPLFFFRQVMALLRIKKARKSFLKTTHTHLLYIDDLLQTDTKD